MKQPLPVLHKGATRIAIVLLVIAIAMIAFGRWLGTNQGYSFGHAMFFVGIFIFVSALVIGLVFVHQERLYRKTMSNPLISFELASEDRADMIQKNVESIKAQHLLSLIIMLFFFLIVIVFGLFLGPEGRMMSLAMLIIAAIISLASVLITRFRIGRIRRSDGRVFISKKGAFLHGQFHSWATLGSRIDSVVLKRYDSDRSRKGHLKIVYSALTRTGRLTMKLHINYPVELEQELVQVCSILGWPQQ